MSEFQRRIDVSNNTLLVEMGNEIKSLRAQLDAATRRAEAAEAAAEWQRQRAEAAEAALAAVPERDIIMIYNACPLNTATQSSIMRVRDWLARRQRAQEAQP